jgi:hypothetical protein
MRFERVDHIAVDRPLIEDAAITVLSARVTLMR